MKSFTYITVLSIVDVIYKPSISTTAYWVLEHGFRSLPSLVSSNRPFQETTLNAIPEICKLVLRNTVLASLVWKKDPDYVILKTQCSFVMEDIRD